MSFHANTYLSNMHKKITTIYARAFSSVVIKNFLIYGCGSILLRGITIFLAPITLNILTPAHYGLFSLVTSFNNIFIACIGLGLRQVFYIEYFHCDDVERKSMTNTILGIYVLINVPIIILCACNSQLLNAYVFNNNATPTLIFLCLLYSFIFFFVELFYQHLQYASKALSLTMLQITAALTTLSCTVYFLWWLRLGIIGILCGYIMGLLGVFCASIYWYMKENYWATFSFKQTKEKFFSYIILGLPFIPSILFAWALSSGDKWVLTHYATLHDVGIYAIADAFSQLFYMVVLYPLGSSYVPWLFSSFAQNKHDLMCIERKNRKMMYVTMLCTALLITVGYILGKPIIYWVLPHHYHESVRYVWLILMGNVFLMGTYFASGIIQYHKKTYFLAFALCVPALLNICLNILLIPYFGIYGCAGATLFAYFCYFVVTVLYNKHLCKKLNKF